MIPATVHSIPFKRDTKSISSVDEKFLLNLLYGPKENRILCRREGKGREGTERSRKKKEYSLIGNTCMKIHDGKDF
jgi:hypothetical protein